MRKLSPSTCIATSRELAAILRSTKTRLEPAPELDASVLRALDAEESSARVRGFNHRAAALAADAATSLARDGGGRIPPFFRSILHLVTEHRQFIIPVYMVHILNLTPGSGLIHYATETPVYNARGPPSSSSKPWRTLSVGRCKLNAVDP
jgi:hypothetical protein